MNTIVSDVTQIGLNVEVSLKPTSRPKELRIKCVA
jgi:hypothetical protein